MAYSRWGGSRWYTYGAAVDKEDRDTAEFVCNCEISFTAKELREDREQCLDDAIAREGNCTPEEREELSGYMDEFLVDVDGEFPARP